MPQWHAVPWHGKNVAAGETSLVEMAGYATTVGDAPIVSGKQELYEIIHTEYI